jgi:hypothetical protein
MLADLISEGTREGLEAARARGRTGGRKPKLTNRQVTITRQMYDEKDPDGKRKYTVNEIAETFHPRLPQNDLPPPRTDQHTTVKLNVIRRKWRPMTRSLTTGQLGETDQNRGRSTCRAPGDPPEPPGADHPARTTPPEDCGGPDARATTGGTTAAGNSGSKLISHGFGRSPSWLHP